MHNSLRIDIDHEECEYSSEPDIIGLQEIAGPDRMVLQERAKFRWSAFAHVSLNRTFGDSNAELHEFAAYSLGAPKDIFGRNAVNECDDFRVNSGTAILGVLRLPKPVNPKSLAVPTEYRFWLHEPQGVAPMWQEAREQDNESTFMGLEYGTLDFSRCDYELLAKQGILQQ